jgi:vesicle transport protein SEC22
VLETIDRPFYFIKFEKFIKKKKQDYVDTGSRSNIERLNKEISDVHKIMTDNISLLLDREKNFESVASISSNIVQESEQFKKKAKETRIKMLLGKYMIFIAIFAILLLFVVFKYYF